MAFIQYMMQIVMAFLMISMISIMLPRASVSANRINEVLETEPDIQDKPEIKKFDNNKKGLVEFKNVSFRYPDADTGSITNDIKVICQLIDNIITKIPINVHIDVIICVTV